MTENTQPETALDSTTTSAKESPSAMAATTVDAEPPREHAVEAGAGAGSDTTESADSTAVDNSGSAHADEAAVPRPHADSVESVEADSAESPDSTDSTAQAPTGAEEVTPQPSGSQPPEAGSGPKQSHGQDSPSAPPKAVSVPADPEIDPEEAMDAAKWGRVDGEGRVYVQDNGTEREVGQFPDAPVAEAMAFYVRRFLDLKATVDLFATRLPQLSVREIDSTLKSIEQSLAEPAAVGDLDGLRARFAALRTVAAERRAAVAAERAAAKEQALKDRTAIVERAEAISAQDPARTQWKSSGAELRELLERWKEAQRRGPRLDRPTEDGLWKRFSHARTAFDRHRRQFFSELDAKQAQVKAAKEALIKRAEELSGSTDWAGTSAKYRGLLEEWKKAGRASRKEDDALWARFRAAQQVFFDARRAKDAAADAEYAENLKVKEALLVKAEALLPVKDVRSAKRALRPIQDAWEEAGRVPRSALRRIEGRMRAVEDAIREAENAEWRRTDPETKARAEGLAGQLESSIAELEKDLAAAASAGDAKKVAEAEAALTARRAWLEQVRRSARA
ncbi:DUF349 domain-containing protein [Actinomyces gerencseriae]|uniref:DUF349 domain-containing protein n=1 Tax=Actinomyces gerencseriae TaxID=52769 RepID=UPI0023EF68B9|nr:DUF349 domain-containing protein [Actinomyces gerencseriae]